MRIYCFRRTKLMFKYTFLLNLKHQLNAFKEKHSFNASHGQIKSLDSIKP